MKQLLSLGLLLVLTSGLFAQTDVYKENWESLSAHNEAPEWFSDAKFGIYFHWGVFSVPAYYSEWYSYNFV